MSYDHLEYHATELILSILDHPKFKKVMASIIEETLKKAPVPEPIETAGWEDQGGAYFARHQVAAFLQLGKTTIWKWEKEGIFPKGIKLREGDSGAVRYSRTDIEYWLQCKRLGRDWQQEHQD